MATGTTGTCALSAIRNGPRLNGSNAPVRLRVPSGNVRNELPALSDSAACSMAAIDCSRLPRSIGTNPPI